MRIVFLGTPEFASHSLKILHQAGKNIVGVITAPDKKAGRGQQLRSSAVKEYASKHQIECLQPTNLKDPEFLAQLKALEADIQIVVAFRMLPELVWNMPPLGTMNLHASLLPKYRGAAPINWAIINGEKETGVTTFFLKHEIDTGEVLLQDSIAIDQNETAGSLHDKLMESGAELLLKSINLIEKGDYSTKSQLDLCPKGIEISDLSHAPKIFREDCHIQWEHTAEVISSFIRGLSPYPAAWSQLKRKSDGKMFNLKIFNVAHHEDESQTTAGEIYSKGSRLYASGSNGILELVEVQIEGKKKMRSNDFLNGNNLDDYEEQLY